MDWLDRWNEAMEELEKTLEGEPDVGRAAQRAGCSEYHFRRMFSYLAGLPLSEYLRRRRMSRAAADLQAGERVLDVALRYGYESPTAFNRAFQSVHGVPPSAAQRGETLLKAYPRISFKITVKGEAEMEYRIVKKESFRIVGAKVKLEGGWEENFQQVPLFWQRAARENLILKLVPLMDGALMGILGVSTCIRGNDVDYYIAVATDREAPEGMEEYTVPACTWAVFSGEGQSPQAIQSLQQRIVSEWLPSSGYEYADAPDIEVYLNSGPQNSQFEVWLPVSKKAAEASRTAG